MVTAELVHTILGHYKLNIGDIHGVSHWARVMENGRRLAASTGARLEVVELFAVFHDARRMNNGHDPDHGKRGAELASRLRGNAFEIADDDFGLLLEACTHHTWGRIMADVTIQTCWDSDRLDLARVLILPDPDLLCTETARLPETLSWANKRSSRRVVPALVKEEWGIDLPGARR